MNSTPQQTANMIIGVVVLLMVLAAAYYFDVVSVKAEAQPVTIQDFSPQVQAINALADAGSVVDKIVPLQVVPSSQPAAVTYSPGDLGKSDDISSAN